MNVELNAGGAVGQLEVGEKKGDGGAAAAVQEEQKDVGSSGIAGFSGKMKMTGLGSKG